MSETFKVRASSFGSFFDCNRRWAEINLYGNSMPSTAPAAIGSAVHESTAAFDQHIADNDPISVIDAAEVAVNYLRHPEEEVVWGDVRQDKAVERALGVHTRYCNEIAPQMQYEVIEKTLEPLQIEINDDVTVELTGTLDRIYTKNIDNVRKYGVSDVKTGLQALSANQGKHKAQVGVYSLLAESTLGLEMTLPESIIALQTSTNYGAGIFLLPDSRETLLGNDEEVGLLEAMGNILKSGRFYGNSNSWLCSPKFCPHYQRCIYK